MVTLLLLLTILGQIPPFTARFEQITLDSGRTDTVRGRIFFAAPWRIYYDVDFPIRQWLSVVKNVMTVYYPEETLAYFIRSKNQMELPVAQQSLHAIDERRTMTKMGFRLVQTRHCAETTYTIWQTKMSRIPFGRVVFGRIGRSTVHVEVFHQQDRLFLRSRFFGYVRIDTFELPTRIETERYDINGRTTTEILTYSNLDTSRVFLSDLGRFVVPQGTRIRNVDW